MRAFLLNIGAFAISLLASFTLLAQQPLLSFQSKLSTDSILIGDRAELTISVSLPKGYQVNFPMFADSIIKGIEVVGLPTIDTTSTSTGDISLIYRQSITSFDEGYYRIPNIKLPFTNGSINDTAQTSPMWFMVNTLPPDTTISEIYDIKLPMAEPYTFAEVAPWVGGALLLAALIALLVVYLKRRKTNQPIFFARKPPLPPHVIALRELESIKANKLWDTNNHKHYHTVLTDVLRVYIEGRFGVPAMEQTTEETIKSIDRSDLSSKLINDLQDILSLADLVKFARFTPSIAQNEDCLSFGFRFVNETKVETAPEPEKEDGTEQTQLSKNAKEQDVELSKNQKL